MKNLTICLLASILLSTISSQVLASECQVPEAPAIPDGKSASEAELIAAQKAMKAYQGKLNVYRECLTAATNKIDKSLEGAAEKEATYLTAYNTSVDSEKNVAEQFNTAVRAFKAKSK